MATDLEALLAAVVANPADDVARLVYADCLEENGNEPRARFIRLQIEAERFHPNSRARADLTAEAAALFATHWPDWWAEVCAATGLRPAARAPKSALGRLARWVGRGPRPGAPDERREWEPFSVYSDWSQPNSQFRSVEFARGFPERLRRGIDSPTDFDQGLPARWARAVPLVALHSSVNQLALPGPYLAGLRELELDTPFTIGLHEWLTSPHLGQLDSFAITGSGDSHPEWVEFLTLPVMGQLKRLQTGIASYALGEALAGAEALGAVRELDFHVEGPGGQGLAALHGSPLAARVERLKLSGELVAGDIVGLSGSWPQLRALSLYLGGPMQISEADTGAGWWAAVRALARDTSLPALEDLCLAIPNLTDGLIDELVQSPLTKQLKHFALEVTVVNATSDTALRRLPEAFDGARIETIFACTTSPRREFAELTRAFGDRVRLVTA